MNIRQNEIADCLINILSNLLEVPKEQISLSSQLFVDLDVESVELVQIALILEKEFNITLGERDLWNLPWFLIKNGHIVEGQFDETAKSLIKKQIKSMNDSILDSLREPAEFIQYLTISHMALHIDRLMEG